VPPGLRLEEEAMPHMIDQHGVKVHRQPIETFVTRVIWGLDKNWMKQRLVWAMSKKQIATRADVTKCLTEAVNELRMSKESNLDPSCAYPNTMSHLNADCYALAARDAPGLYGQNQGPGIAVIMEEMIRRLGAETAARAASAPTTKLCYGCGKPGHFKNDTQSPLRCVHTARNGDTTWTVAG
jgi:hypothetical protein